MSEVIGEAVVRVRGDTSGFKQSASPGVVSGMKEIALTAAKTFGLVFGAEKLFHFGEDAISEAALTEKATENIKAQFGSAAEGVLRFSDTAAGAFGISKTDAEQFSSSIGLVTKNLGIGKQQGADMAVGLEKLAGSVGMIKGQDPASYFDKLKLALLGNTRGLKQMGISLDSTAISQYALDNGIIKTTVDHAKVADALAKSREATKTYNDAVSQSGRGSAAAHAAQIKMNLANEAYKKTLDGTVGKLTASQKAQAIYGLATQKLGGYMDQARAHGDDWANEQIKLKAELANVKEEIGAALLPAMAALGSIILTYIIPALGAAASGFKAIISAIPPDVLKGIAIGIAVVAGAWLAYTIAQYAAATALMAMNAAFAISPFGLVIIGIVALVAAMYVLYQRVSVVRTVVQAVFGFLQSFVPAALNVIKQAVIFVFSFIRAYIMVYVTIIKGIIQVAMDLIRGNWSKAWSDIRNIVTTVFGLILGVLRGAIGLLGGVARSIGQAILDGIVNLVKQVPGKVSSLIHGIPGAIGSVAHLLYNVGVQMIQGLISGIKSMASSAVDAAKGVVSGAVDGAKSLLGIGSPSKLMHDEVGRPMVQGIATGINAEIPALRQLLASITAELPSAANAGSSTRGRSDAISASQRAGAGAGLGGGGVTITGPVTIQPRDPADFMRRLNLIAAAAR